jgi:chromosome segregation ATPase
LNEEIATLRKQLIKVSENLKESENKNNKNSKDILCLKDVIKALEEDLRRQKKERETVELKLAEQKKSAKELRELLAIA